MIQAVSDHCQTLFTMAIHIQEIPVKIGAQVLTGLVYLGRIAMEMCQVTRRLLRTTNGIQMLQRLYCLYQMRVLKMVTLRSKQMTSTRLTRLTTVVLRRE